jgi:drug/metabolite transporter (DMT)-like permease
VEVQTFLAVALALVSALCYAAAAVLQHREASTHVAGGLDLLGRLVRRRAWWAAMAATALGATVHLAALGAGSLVLVQPLGITALVLALLISARLTGLHLGRRAWAGVGCVLVGLPGVLSTIPRSAGIAAPVLGYWSAVTIVATAVSVLVAAARGLARSRPPLAAVLHAVAAALCFGLTSGTARAIWSGHAQPVYVAAALASALAGLVLAQHAYRDGGLGAPLATLTLVDPLTAGLLGVLVLGEPISTSPVRLAIGVAGALLTAAGVAALAPRPVVAEPGPRAELEPVT